MTPRQTPDAVREAAQRWFLSFEQDIRGRWQILHHGKHVEYIQGGDRDAAYKRLEALQWAAILAALDSRAEDAGEERQWPDIGDDPMQHRPYEDRMAVSADAIRKAYAVQQPIVPDQTALVWRWHLGALLEAEIRLRSILADETATPAPNSAGNAGALWTFNEDTRDIECGNAPVFRVYEADDFPCIEPGDRAKEQDWFDAQAQTAVLMLNSLLHDSGDDITVATPAPAVDDNDIDSPAARLDMVRVALTGIIDNPASAVPLARAGLDFCDLTEAQRAEMRGDAPAVDAVPAGEVERFVIRRNGAFFRPNAQGYTAHIIAAGFYTREEADSYASVEGVTIEPLERYRAEAERTIAKANHLLAALSHGEGRK